MIRTLRRPVLLLLLVAMFSVVASGAAYADSKSTGAKAKPNSITVSSAVSMIVNGLHLNIDNIRFIKEPKASDYYTKVKDSAPYAYDFIIAQFTGLELPKDIDPNAYVTREQFAKWLYGGLSSTGEYAWIEIFVDLKDANKVSKGYMDSIQKLLIAGIASTDSHNRYWPKMDVTKPQAERMVKKAAAFAEQHHPAPNPEIGILSDVKLNVEKYADGVDRVTVSAQVPHPGYGLDIASVDFVQGTAVISYRVVQPDPTALYPQVISEAKAFAFIPTGTKASLGEQVPSEPRA
ncbi:S-layer homology domain-containing protein [Cohnella panacarvi]|uniref:S-layer homology domain-containing protein n=1 Tax=Cohnella panacarvi TaxID=400776 RepID=UPI0012EC9019|nr:S-layer homology domain-containing protein [Cohnella panacarvi]